MINILLSDSWKKLLSSEINAPYFTDLLQFLAAEKKNHRIFPPEKEITSPDQYPSMIDPSNLPFLLQDSSPI
ncbi:MAG: hypothetical protein ABGX43_09675, partial [Nitrospinaceae bacterium]